MDELVRRDDNYKDILLRRFQKNGWSHPTYTVIKAEGPSHKRIYTVGVDDIQKDPVTGKIVKRINCYLGQGTGKSKKEAEQRASKQALELLDKNDIENKMKSRLE